MNSILKNFIIFTYTICAILYAFIFEVGWNETFRLFQSNLSLIPYFDVNFTSYQWLVAPDRGPIEWLLMNLFKFINQDNIYVFRLFFISFNLLLIYLLIKKENLQIALFTVLLTFLNIDFFHKTHLISIYSFNTMITLVFIYKIFEFKTSKKSLAILSTCALLSVMSFFSAILPVCLGFLFLIKYKKVTATQLLGWNIPLFVYSIIKGLMIVRYRFVDRMHYSDFLQLGFNEKVLKVLDFYGFSLSFIQPPFKLLAALCIIIFILKIVIYYLKSTDIKARFFIIYNFIFLSTFTLMSLTGAEEIETRYYFPLLVLFNIHVAKLLLNFKSLPIKFISTATLLVLICHPFISHFSSLQMTPLLSMNQSLRTYNFKPTSVCLPQYPSRIHHLNRIHLFFNDQNNYIEHYKCTQSNLGERPIIITWNQPYSSNTNCTESDKSYCLKPSFNTNMMKYDLKRTEILAKKYKNQKIYFQLYSLNE